MKKFNDIRIVCKHCNNEIGLFDKEYITPIRKKYTKCTHCGNSEHERRRRVAIYNKQLANVTWEENYSSKDFFGVHEGFYFIKEV